LGDFTSDIKDMTLSI